MRIPQIYQAKNMEQNQNLLIKVNSLIYDVDSLSLKVSLPVCWPASKMVPSDLCLLVFASCVVFSHLIEGLVYVTKRIQK
jgi:hypothetical protein